MLLFDEWEKEHETDGKSKEEHRHARAEWFTRQGSLRSYHARWQEIKSNESSTTPGTVLIRELVEYADVRSLLDFGRFFMGNMVVFTFRFFKKDIQPLGLVYKPNTSFFVTKHALNGLVSSVISCNHLFHH